MSSLITLSNNATETMPLLPLKYMSQARSMLVARRGSSPALPCLMVQKPRPSSSSLQLLLVAWAMLLGVGRPSVWLAENRSRWSSPRLKVALSDGSRLL